MWKKTLHCSLKIEYQIFEYVTCIVGNTAQYDVYYGFPGSKELTNKAGEKIKNLDAILNCLEAGEVAYDERRREYEMLKN